MDHCGIHSTIIENKDSALHTVQNETCYSRTQSHAIYLFIDLMQFISMKTLEENSWYYFNNKIEATGQDIDKH